jgi:uncharacterized repeat protein (TIGR03803 family)
MTAKNQPCGSITFAAPNIALLLVVAFVTVLVTTPAQAITDKVLYTFTGMADGGTPRASVITDTKGNIYGTTQLGGDLTCNPPNGCGTVYKLSKTGKETVLYSFTGGADGAYPYAALLMDAAGNLYGTASAGGGGTGCFGSGCGTVFKLSKAGKETVLYAFQGGTDGGRPYSALIVDAAGNFYGTAILGGDLSCRTYGCGVVYKLSKARKQTVLYSFTGAADGSYPAFGSLAVDAKGNLYGTTEEGGNLTCNSPNGCGVVYRLSKTRKQTVLHTFTGPDGENPEYTVTLDAKGNLYGTAPNGGANSAGVVFKISNASATKRPGPLFKVLHSFGSGADGALPVAGVSIDPKGNLWIPTGFGGTFGNGALCKVTSTGKESVFHSFSLEVDGANPVSAATIIPTQGLAKPGLPKGFSWSLYSTNTSGSTSKNGLGAGDVVEYRF